MLLNTMNDQEICSQVQSEYEKILNTTIPRLLNEYDRERKKLKVKKDDPYKKEYAIRSHGKNNWIIFVQKPPSSEKYKTGTHISFMAVVYYYGDQGLRVLHIENRNVVVSFSSHFFKRYNERMKLNLSNPIDIVKAYFRTGVYGRNKLIEREGKLRIIGFRSEGLQFGLVKYNKTYIEWKTFVNQELAFRSQHKMKGDVLGELKAGITAGQLLQSYGMVDDEFEKNLLVLQNSYLSLTGNRFSA